MKEADIQAKILKYINSLDEGWATKVIKANTAGVPDILACIKGHFVAIEVKTKYGRVSELQKIKLNQIRDAKGSAIVARDIKDVKNFIKGIV